MNKNSELIMARREQRLGQNVGRMLRKFGLKDGDIFTSHVQERFLNEDSFYPIVNKVVLKLADGTRLIVQSRGIIQAGGKLTSRLHFDLIKAQEKPKPNFSCMCGEVHNKNYSFRPNLSSNLRANARVNVPYLIKRARMNKA